MIKLIVPRQNQPLHEGDGGLYVYLRPSHHKNKKTMVWHLPSIISIIV